MRFSTRSSTRSSTTSTATAKAAATDDHTCSRNKKVALLIAVIALFLAFSETLGKSAQTNALNHQIEASNLWNFFQAKNIRRTLTLVAGEEMKVDLPATSRSRARRR